MMLPQHYFQQAAFLQSATTKKPSLPKGVEKWRLQGVPTQANPVSLIAFVRRSPCTYQQNAGAYSALINFFQLPDEHSLVDLPGYGYAKVPEAAKLEWQKFIEAYLIQRKTCKV